MKSARLRFAYFCLLLLACSVLAINSGCGPNPPENNYGGLVPNEATAIKLAEVILLAKYGESIIKQRPFVATLKADSI